MLKKIQYCSSRSVQTPTGFMIEDKMQRQRFEHKYLLTEAKAAQVGAFIDSYLERDPHGAGQPGLAYPVHSIYLDSDNLDTYWWTINGAKNRFKLRVRFYDNRPDTPVFFEIKRRVDRVIFKQRAAVRKEYAPLLLDGQLAEPGWLINPDPRSIGALAHFTHLSQQLGARLKVHVGYSREAWVDARTTGVRATLDRRVGAEPEAFPRFSTRLKSPCFAFGRTVILELKFTDRFPNWFRDLVETFDLMQCGAAKYCAGVTMIGEARLGHRLEVFAQRGLDPGTLLSTDSVWPCPGEETDECAVA
jgi:hypothetical protein